MTAHPRGADLDASIGRGMTNPSSRRLSGALDGLAAAYEKEGKIQEAVAAHRQAEDLRAQGGKS